MLTFEELAYTASAQPTPDRVSTGFADLDEATGGPRAGDIWLVVGTPGQGVSTLLTQWAGRWSTQHDWDTWLICPRDDAAACTTRLQASLGLVPAQHLLNGTTSADEDDRLERASESLRTAPLRVNPARWSRRRPPCCA